MRLRLVLIFCVAWLAAGVARADFTWVNSDANGLQISHKDNNKASLQATEGNILQAPDGKMYAYGHDVSDGFNRNLASPFGGFRVYEFDGRFTDLGLLFDPTTTYWQDRCKGENSLGDVGCWEMRGMYNAANNNYVFWFLQVPGSNTPAAHTYFVLVCTLPYSTPATIATNCTPAPDPTGFDHASLDFGPFVDDDASAYLMYADPSDGSTNYIIKLNSDYTAPTGVSTVVDGINGEGILLFKHAGTYFAGSGPACDSCSAGAKTTFVTSSSVQGTYGSPQTPAATTCGAQAYSMSVLTVGGQTNYLYTEAQWDGGTNQGLANLYYQPFTFTGTTIDAYTCAPTVTLAGFTSTPFPSPSPVPDQTSYAEDKFLDYCNIDATTQRLQTFTPTQTPLTAISLSLGQQGDNTTHVGMDGAAVIEVVTLDGSKNPATILDTITIPAASLKWSEKYPVISTTHPITITPLVEVGIKLRGTNTYGCVAYSLYNGADGPLYAGGVNRYSLDGGSTWTTQPNIAMMFSTFSETVAGGGRRGGLFR